MKSKFLLPKLERHASKGVPVGRQRQAGGHARLPHGRSVAAHDRRGGVVGHDTWEPIDQLQGERVKALVNAYNEKLRAAK